MGADITTSVWTLGEMTSGKCFCIQRNEASKTEADVDATKTGGMFLRITQIAKVCTVDASVAKLPVLFALGSMDITSTNPSYMAFIC